MIENNRYYWSHLKTKTVTVRVAPRKTQHGIVFRVNNMIDLGNGRQTVMLEHVDYPKTYQNRSRNSDVAVPFRMGNMDFIYTSPGQPKIQNVHNLLSTLYKNEEVEKIVADVLSPGDLLIFKQEGKSLQIKMIDALRIVKANSYKKNKSQHAL
ncbi:MAG: hypothetical protein COA45_07295 [Zetaproteobacteria bacterium]|nr:MAG: hypothetical protein COA45_07295 [Zetaproteobacteria bacterium]